MTLKHIPQPNVNKVTTDAEMNTGWHDGSLCYSEEYDLLYVLDGGSFKQACASGWDDLQVSIAGSRLPASGAPTWTAYKGGQVLAFDGTSTNTMYFTAQLPHSYDAGDIEFHIHYVPEDATAGNVRWVFTHSWASMNSTFPAETTITKVAAVPGVADQHTYLDMGDLTANANNNGISSMIICSLARTGGHGDDTYNSKSVYLVGLDFHFHKNIIGSRTETAR